MAVIKLQFSVICENDEKHSFINIIPGFSRGEVPEFYVVNKWVWDEGAAEAAVPEEGYYQKTEIIEDGRVIAGSTSGSFRVKLSHTHHNHFQGLKFTPGCNYRIRVRLFDERGAPVEEGCLTYPVYVK